MSNIHTLHPGQVQPVTAKPLPTLADLVAANRSVAAYATAQDRARKLPDLPRPHAMAPGTAEKWRQTALGQRRQLLSSRAASEAADAVRNAFQGPQHAPVVLLLTGQLLDCYATDKLNDPDVFYEALNFDLTDAGYSDAVIAAACLDLRRTSKFRPSIAEILECCKRKRQFAEAVFAGHGRYVERLTAVHLVLHHSGGDPDPVEAVHFAPCAEEPLLVEEYLGGVDNAWWYDEVLNTDLMIRAGETDEEWRQRFLRMKVEAEADPAGHRLRVERARGALAGGRAAREWHRRSGLNRRRDACAQIERIGLDRFPDRKPADLYAAWLCGADSAFTERFGQLEPNYDAEERARHERDARERAEREAHLRRYRTSRTVSAR